MVSYSSAMWGQLKSCCIWGEMKRHCMAGEGTGSQHIQKNCLQSKTKPLGSGCAFLGCSMQCLERKGGRLGCVAGGFKFQDQAVTAVVEWNLKHIWRAGGSFWMKNPGCVPLRWSSVPAQHRESPQPGGTIAQGAAGAALAQEFPDPSLS